MRVAETEAAKAAYEGQAFTPVSHRLDKHSLPAACQQQAQPVSAVDSMRAESSCARVCREPPICKRTVQKC